MAQVVINEIMYDPRIGPEWVEIYNPGPDTINLSGWAIEDSDTSSRTVISGQAAPLLPRGFVVVVGDMEEEEALGLIQEQYGPFKPARISREEAVAESRQRRERRVALRRPTPSSRPCAAAAPHSPRDTGHPV